MQVPADDEKKRGSKRLPGILGGSSTKKAKFVLVGGGVAAAWFCHAYLAAGGKGKDIMMITMEPCLPYYKCALVSSVLRGTRKLQDLSIWSENWYKESDIAVHYSSEIVELNPAKRQVVDAKGQAYAYTSALVISSGCRALRPNIPGHDLAGVYYVFDAESAVEFKTHLTDKKEIVVIGDCYRAMSCAMTLSKEGHHVTMVMPGQHVMERAFPLELARLFERFLEGNHVQIVRERECVAFLEREGAVRACKFDNGEVVDCDLVVGFFGTVPNIEAFRDHMDVQKDAKYPGILVDNYFRTKVPNVYALGAAASLPFSQSGNATLAQADFAQQSGIYLARCLADPGNPVPFLFRPHFAASVLEVKYVLLGDLVGESVRMLGEFGDELVCVWVWEDKLLGVFASGTSAHVEDQLRTLVLSESVVDRGAVDSATTLKDLYVALGVREDA